MGPFLIAFRFLGKGKLLQPFPDAYVVPRQGEGGDGQSSKNELFLAGAKEDAPVDESHRQALQRKREQVAESCGRLLSAAFELCGDLLPEKILSRQQQVYADEMKSQLPNCLAPENTANLERLAEARAGFAPDPHKGRT
jgi:hypothetical protein